MWQSEGGPLGGLAREVSGEVPALAVLPDPGLHDPNPGCLDLDYLAGAGLNSPIGLRRAYPKISIPLPHNEIQVLPTLHKMQCRPDGLPAPVQVKIGLL